MEEDYTRKSIGALGDVHPVLSRPIVRLAVWFKGQEVTDGAEEVSSDQMTQEPLYEIVPSHQLLKRVFSLVLVDLDSEQPQRLQWAKANVHINDRGKREDEDLVAYEPPNPEAAAGFHRFQIALYEQPSLFTHEYLVEALGSNGRAGFDHKRWAQQHRMDGPITTYTFHCSRRAAPSGS